ncbi:hypothetical protein CYMTET_48251 [Cymbomonas tetramitiformis]|uniref:Uncharacterized protein n=1 Tax=Cymbomonas tetramitiformis TaxID=36881 RepID=A0AAE0BTY0_9CHLO|nr:hypothetical protein CYMTET_48251 [Cymbomonas tetramitiformis]
MQYWGVVKYGASGVTRILRPDGRFDFVTSVHRVCLTCGTASYDHDPRVLLQLPEVLQSEVDMHLSIGHMNTSTMLSRASHDALRLLSTRKVGSATFATTAHDLALKDYEHRELHYYSLATVHCQFISNLVGDSIWPNLSPAEQMPLTALRLQYLEMLHSTWKVAPFPSTEELGSVPVAREIVSNHLRDGLAAIATYRRGEVQGVVAKDSSAFDVTYFTGPVVGSKGIATQTTEKG